MIAARTAEADLPAGRFLDDAHEARVRQVVEEGGVHFEQMHEAVVVRAPAVHLEQPLIRWPGFGGQKPALQRMKGFANALHFVLAQRIFDHHVAIDFKEQALPRSQCGKRGYLGLYLVDRSGTPFLFPLFAARHERASWALIA